MKYLLTVVFLDGEENTYKVTEVPFTSDRVILLATSIDDIALFFVIKNMFMWTVKELKENAI